MDGRGVVGCFCLRTVLVRWNRLIEQELPGGRKISSPPQGLRSFPKKSRKGAGSDPEPLAGQAFSASLRLKPVLSPETSFQQIMGLQGPAPASRVASGCCELSHKM